MGWAASSTYISYVPPHEGLVESKSFATHVCPSVYGQLEHSWPKILKLMKNVSTHVARTLQISYIEDVQILYQIWLLFHRVEWKIYIFFTSRVT